MGSKLIIVIAIYSLYWMALAMQTHGHGAIFDVKKYGAKADGQSDDSQAIRSAWKEACACKDPSRVVIPRGTYMVGGVDFQGPCKAPIAIEGEGTLKAPAGVNKGKPQDGWITFDHIDHFTISGGVIFDGQGEIAWKQNDCAKTGRCNSLPINLRFNAISNAIIEGITSMNSKLFHINILGCNNVTLRHVTISAPEDSLNTDGIHIGRSTMINISNVDIKTGDDCVSLGDGCQRVNVEKVTCGPGHGISVGSLGRYHEEQPVRGITVRNCTLTNTMNGVRVKTWPASLSGIASDLHFEDIVMNNVSNPILIDQQYCPYGQCQAQVPSRVKISNVSFRKIKGTSATEMAVKLVCSRGIPCQKVEMGDIDLGYIGTNSSINSTISQCANVKPTFFGHLFPSPCSFAPTLPLNTP